MTEIVEFDVEAAADSVPQPTPPAASTSPPNMGEEGALFQLIERAARDPNIDIDKLERLFSMYERLGNRRAEQAYNIAMAAAQAEMTPVVRNRKNPQTRSNYADLASLSDAITPIYAKHGFGVSFSTKTAPQGFLGIVAEVTHGGGFGKRYEYDVPTDGLGLKGNANMTPVQAFGSTISYGRRYAKLMIFDIATKDDVDGNAPKEAPAVVSDQQLADLQDAITSTGTNIDKFLKYYRIESLADLPASQLGSAMSQLNRRQRA